MVFNLGLVKDDDIPLLNVFFINGNMYNLVLI